MTREDIEKTNKVSPLGKLIVEWCSRRDLGVIPSKTIALALGLLTAEIADEAHRLRLENMLMRHVTTGKDRRDLSLHEVMLAPEVWAAYNPQTSKPKKAA